VEDGGKGKWYWGIIKQKKQQKTTVRKKRKNLGGRPLES